MCMITTDAATLPHSEFLHRLALCFETHGRPGPNGVTVYQVDDRVRDAIAHRLRTLGDNLSMEQ